MSKDQQAKRGATILLGLTDPDHQHDRQWTGRATTAWDGHSDHADSRDQVADHTLGWLIQVWKCEET